jgi:hypothetical protein
MDASIEALWGIMFLLIIGVVLFARRRRRRIGSGGAGTVYDWQTADERRATEIIVEERAAARDPESADGILPKPPVQR